MEDEVIQVDVCDIKDMGYTVEEAILYIKDCIKDKVKCVIPYKLVYMNSGLRISIPSPPPGELILE